MIDLPGSFFAVPPLSAWCIPFVLGLLLGFVVEAFARPRPVAPWRRDWRCLAVHAGLWALGFAALLAIYQRPWVATVNLLSLLVLLTVIGNIKYITLREPFIYPDFEYFTDAIRHPQFYLPFFGVGNAIMGAAAYVAAMVAGVMLEPALGETWAQSLVLAACLAVVAAVLLWCAGRRPVSISAEGGCDQQVLGMLCAWWRYRQEEGRQLDLSAHAPFSMPPDREAEHLPDLIMVQCESFFDPRRTFRGLRHDILAVFDAMLAESAEQGLPHGHLRVPSWGANTVRTEYAVLSGISPEVMSVHRYNPYRSLGRHAVPTVAHYLRRLGYRTLCVHPYARAFYRRDKAIPALGFDVFLAQDDFPGAARFGPYIADSAVAEKVCRLLDDEGQPGVPRPPLFIYVITMENHGPLQWEQFDPGEQHFYFPQGLPTGCDDAVVYARHIANTDRMLQQLKARLEKHERSASLAVFGDHVPIMPAVYAQMGEPEGSTDFFIWSNPPARTHRSQPRPASASCTLQSHELAQALLAHALRVHKKGSSDEEPSRAMSRQPEN